MGGGREIEPGMICHAGRQPQAGAGARAGSPGPKHHAKVGKELVLVAPWSPTRGPSWGAARCTPGWPLSLPPWMRSCRMPRHRHDLKYPLPSQTGQRSTLWSPRATWRRALRTDGRRDRGFADSTGSRGQGGDRWGPFAFRPSGCAEALGLVWEESLGTEGQAGRAGVDRRALPWTMALA